VRPTFFFVAAIAVSSLIIVKHHSNIRRLFAGTEYRFGATKSA
jgi:glycerol-3-phosphate acyltransferase PlsY